MDLQEAIYCMKVMADEEVCEECNYYQSCDHTKQTDMARIVISAMQDLQEYKQLGTLEEVREVVERQHAKKPSLMLGIYGRVYECKECGNELEMYSKYCPFCGQPKNWKMWDVLTI